MTFSSSSSSHHPPGWVPPFSGAPPPVPPGVNPQTWGAGAWSFNPAYLCAPPQNNAGWAMGYGWSGQHHHQQPFNPYKRIPKPPSAEYLATELSDNPLGLTNMIPRDEIKADDGTPQTPWIWNPPGIGAENDDGLIAAAYTDELGHRISHELRELRGQQQQQPYQHHLHRSPTPSSSRRSSYDRATSSSIYANMPYPDPSLSRQGSHDWPNGRSPTHRQNSASSRQDISPSHPASRQNSIPSRHSSLDVSPSRPSASRQNSTPSRQGSYDRPADPPTSQNTVARSNSSSSSSALPPLDRPLGRPTDPSSVYQLRFNSPGVPERSPGHSPSRAGSGYAHSSQVEPRRENHDDGSFTARIDLQPTFSPNIVRIPDHYQSPTSRRSSYDDDSLRSSSSSAGSNHLMSQLTSRMEHLSTSHNPLVRQSSLPTSIYGPPTSNPASENTMTTMTTTTTTAAAAAAAEPLSPLLYSKPGPRPVLRGFSVPDMRLNPIPEAASSSASADSTPAHSRSYRVPLRTASPSSSSSSSSSSLSRNVLPLPPHSAPPHLSHTNHHPILSAGGPSQVPMGFLPLSSANVGPSTATRAQTPPPQPGKFTKNKRLRIGFWNRRGDHLTRTMHVVLAPADRAYPPELADYPDRAYRDHLGIELPYDPDRPELLESLALRGKPPVAPYESFVVYA